MMRIRLLLLFIFNTSLVYASAQMGDILIWKGDTLSIFANPLELREDVDSLRNILFAGEKGGISTACWRNYIAEWTIMEDEIYLTNIYTCNYSHHKEDTTKAHLATLFKKEFKKGKIKASWLTGSLLIPRGECVYSVNSQYASIYEKETILFFEAGKLVDKKEFDNTRSHHSYFDSHHDSLFKFIYSTINWSAIPDLGDKEIKVIVIYSCDENSKPYMVKVGLKSDEAIFNEEAKRVISLLPDCDVMYRNGKYYKTSAITDILFSETNRQKGLNKK